MRKALTQFASVATSHHYDAVRPVPVMSTLCQGCTCLVGRLQRGRVLGEGHVTGALLQAEKRASVVVVWVRLRAVALHHVGGMDQRGGDCSTLQSTAKRSQT